MELTKYYNVWNLRDDRWTNAHCLINRRYNPQNSDHPLCLTMEQVKEGYSELLLRSDYEIREIPTEYVVVYQKIAMEKEDQLRRQAHAMKHF